MIRFIFLTAFLLSLAAHAEPAPQVKKCAETTQSNVESSLCLKSELDKLNRTLEKTYDWAIKEAQEFDEFVKTTKHGANTSPENTNVGYLERSQKQFKEYRETECWRQRVAMDTASTAGHKQTACEIKLTIQRLEELDPYHQVKDDEK